MRRTGGSPALFTLALLEFGKDGGRSYAYPDACVVGLVVRDSIIASLSCADSIAFSLLALPVPLKKVSADPPASFDVDITTGFPISRFSIVCLLTLARFLRRTRKDMKRMMAAIIATLTPALMPAIRFVESFVPPLPPLAGMGIVVAI